MDFFGLAGKHSIHFILIGLIKQCNESSQMPAQKIILANVEILSFFNCFSPLFVYTFVSIKTLFLDKNYNGKTLPRKIF